MPLVHRTKWITPPEAEGIARQFEAQAAKANDLAAQLIRVKDDLDYRWEGNAKNSFFAAFTDKPSQLNSYAEELRAKANAIRSIKVSVTETVWEDDPIKEAATIGDIHIGTGVITPPPIPIMYRDGPQNKDGNKKSEKSQSGGSKKKDQWWDPLDLF